MEIISSYNDNINVYKLNEYKQSAIPIDHYMLKHMLKHVKDNQIPCISDYIHQMMCPDKHGNFKDASMHLRLATLMYRDYTGILKSSMNGIPYVASDFGNDIDPISAYKFMVDEDEEEDDE